MTAVDSRRMLSKVPQITVLFWVLKLLTTGTGEAMSDALGQKSVPIAAAIGLFGTILAFRLQIRQTEYRAPYYWFTVMMVAIFGTMIADGIHDGVGIGYTVTTPLFAAITALVFWLWYRSEGTLSIHSINSRKREYYYWAAVFGTFSLGTAAGDLTAMQLDWGYWPSALLFGGLIAIPLIGGLWLRWNAIFSFWFAYIVTRPLGASFADGFSKGKHLGGLKLGDPLVAGIGVAIFVVLVAYVTLTHYDVQRDVAAADGVPYTPHEPHLHEHGSRGLVADAE